MVCVIGVGYSDELLATLEIAGSVGWVRKSKRLVWESGLLSRGAWWLCRGMPILRCGEIASGGPADRETAGSQAEAETSMKA